MKVHSLFTPYRDMNAQEKAEFIGKIRERREVVRTAVVNRKKRAAKKTEAKTRKASMSKMEKILQSMSPADRNAFLKAMEKK